MAINELALRKALEVISRKLDLHDRLIKQMLSVMNRSLEISKALNIRIPNSKELAQHALNRRQLSKAERPVYDLMFTSRNKEIATNLGLSQNTIKSHVRHIRQKLKIERGRKEKYMGDAI
jgi:DNA-binding CsgD family transcriptional regulator